MSPPKKAITVAAAWVVMCGLIWIGIFLYVTVYLNFDTKHWLNYTSGELGGFLWGGIAASLALSLWLKLRP